MPKIILLQMKNKKHRQNTLIVRLYILYCLTLIISVFVLLAFIYIHLVYNITCDSIYNLFSIYGIIEDDDKPLHKFTSFQMACII